MGRKFLPRGAGWRGRRTYKVESSNIQGVDRMWGAPAWWHRISWPNESPMMVCGGPIGDLIQFRRKITRNLWLRSNPRPHMSSIPSAYVINFH
jgi:hypothetical protein